MKARVLIADDASFMRQMIREIIEPEGYEVVGEATNGIEAVDQFMELRPDLVTMDIVMPKRSGIDAVKGILVEDRTSHLGVREGRELQTAPGIPGVCGRDQTQHAEAEQVVPVDAAGHIEAHPPHDVSQERDVIDDQGVSFLLIHMYVT